MDKIKNLDLNDLFEIHSKFTDALLIDIIEDRKYNIPDDIYEYITSDILISLIIRRDEKLDDNWIRFINSIDNIDKPKYFIIQLIELKLYKYIAIIEPKILYKYINYLYKNLTLENVIGIIDMHKTINNSNTYELPYEYIYLITLIMSNGDNCKLLSVTKYCTLYTDVVNKCNMMSKIQVLDMIIERSYEAYIKKPINKSVHIDNMRLLLQHYWMYGGSFIPKGLPYSIYNSYMHIMRNNRRYYKYSSDLTYIMYESRFSIDEDVLNLRQCILQSLIYNFANIEYIMWAPTDDEVEYLTQTYNLVKQSIGLHNSPTDFGKYYELINAKNISLAEFKEIHNIFHSYIDIGWLVVDEPNECVEYIMGNLSDSEIIEYFKNDVDLSMINVKFSLLQYILDNYIMKGNNLKITQRFGELVFPNDEILDVIKDKDYVDLYALFNKYSNAGFPEFLVRYPNLIKHYPNIPSIILMNVLNNNSDAIYEVDWGQLSENQIISEIIARGYFPIKTDREQAIFKQPMCYINTDTIMNIMSTSGKGIGYILDYELPSYQLIIASYLLKEYYQK